MREARGVVLSADFCCVAKAPSVAHLTMGREQRQSSPRPVCTWMFPCSTGTMGVNAAVSTMRHGELVVDKEEVRCEIRWTLPALAVVNHRPCQVAAGRDNETLLRVTCAADSPCCLPRSSTRFEHGSCRRGFLST